MLLSEAWEAYKMDKQLEGYSPRTIKNNALQYRLLIENIGDIDIQNVTLEMLKKYLYNAQQERNLKNTTVNHRQRCIRSLFHWAHAEGHLEKNPTYNLREMKEPQRIPKALSEENLEMLRISCISAREHALIEIFFASGCRLDEIRKMNRSGINWDRRTFVVNGKGDKERECYFTIKTAIWLRKYLNGRKDNDVALFVTERDPHRISVERIREIIKEIARRSEIGVNVYPHILRHTFATHLLNNNAPLSLVSEYMGHADIKTTKIYCQLSGERRRELYQKYM